MLFWSLLELLHPYAAIVGVKNDFSSVRTAGLLVDQPDSLSVQKFQGDAHISFAKSSIGTAKRRRGFRSAKNLRLNAGWVGPERNQFVQQLAVGIVAELCIQFPAEFFGQQKTCGSSDARNRVPQANRHSRTHDGRNGDRFLAGKDFSGNEILLAMFAVTHIGS